MDQKRIAAFTLTALLSMLVVTPIMFTNWANANFCFPPSDPDITFTSPVNTTYTTSDVFLNVTIDTYLTGWFGGPRDESYMRLEYSVDGNKFQPLTIVSAITQGNPGNPAIINCSINLYELSEGNHSLTVKAVFDYYSSNYPKPGRNTLHTESVANAYLTIDAISDTPTPNPTTTIDNKPIDNSVISFPQLVIIVLAVTAIISLLLYYLRKS